MQARGKKKAFPASVSPMVCTLVREVHTALQYIHEIKWDGYRIIGFSKKGKARLASRSGFDYSGKYPLIAQALAKIGHDVVLDGEVVVLNKQGRPDFCNKKPCYKTGFCFYACCETVSTG